MRTILSLVCLMSLSGSLSAEVLTPVALYQRCYAQVTQLKVPASDARLSQVKAGTKDPISACLEVLDSAKLTANGGTTLGAPSNSVAQAVLRTFQSLHYSWFAAKQYIFLVNSSPAWTDATYDVFDPSSPALYYTKALFDPAANYKDAVTSTENLRPVRSVSNPSTGAYTGEKPTAFVSGAATPLVSTGVLLGAAPSGLLPAGGINLGATVGGGFLGTAPYIQLNVGGSIPFTIDGALALPRRWGRGVFLDTLCRTLPAVRTNDVTSLVVSGAQAPFRQSASCTKCHASMDRAATTIRNFQYAAMTTDGNALTPVAVKFSSSTKAAETSWPSSSDSSFASRPPNGTFFFRTYDGTLVNQPVTGVADLGEKIAATDDYYICAAKRYFAYFTGINVEIGDIADPDFAGTMSEADRAARQTVIDLGKKLKSTQKVRILIEDILKLPQYQRSDFGLSGN